MSALIAKFSPLSLKALSGPRATLNLLPNHVFPFPPLLDSHADVRKALAERVRVLPQIAGFEDVLTQIFQSKHAALAAMSGKELRTHTQMSESRSAFVYATTLSAHQTVIASFSSFMQFSV